MKDDNELIAEFMGVEVENAWNPAQKNIPNYHLKWELLMPVIQKIDSLMPSINIPEDLEALKNGIHGSEEYVEVISLPISSPINEIYEAVVKFIQWHNTKL